MNESKAYLEILNEGAACVCRRNVLAVVKFRFGKAASTTFRNALKSVECERRLNAIHELAVQCSSFDELQKAVADKP